MAIGGDGEIEAIKDARRKPVSVPKKDEMR